MRHTIAIIILLNSVACTTITEKKETSTSKTEPNKIESITPQDLETESPNDKPQTDTSIIAATIFDFTLKTGDTVFVIDKIECQNKNETFVLFYKGNLQELRDNQAYVKVNKRYAMAYDTKREGISKDDWWCIPKKRFCYSIVNFTDWGGKLKSGKVC